MTSNIITPVPLKAGAKTYHLANDWNTLCALEREFDLAIFQVVNLFADGAKARLTDFHRLVTTTLCDAEGKKVSPEMASEVAQIAGPEAVTEAVAAALQQILARLGSKPE